MAKKKVSPKKKTLKKSEDVTPSAEDEEIAVANIEDPAEETTEKDELNTQQTAQEIEVTKKRRKKKIKSTGKAKGTKTAVVEAEQEGDDDEEDTEALEDDLERKDTSTASVTEVDQEMEADEEDSDDDDEDVDEEDGTDDDEESSDSDSSSEEDGAEEGQKKRKKSQAKKTPKKKRKSDKNDGEPKQVAVFVRNITKRTTDEEFADFFISSGAKIKGISKEPRRKMAFVVMEDERELHLVEALNGKTLNGNVLFVKKADHQEENRNRYTPIEEATSQRKLKEEENYDDVDALVLVARGLARSVTENLLREAFPTLRALRMPLTDKFECRGFAFLMFPTAEEAKLVMERDYGMEINGQAITLGPYKTVPPNKKNAAPEAGKTKVLFIRNLLYETPEETVKEYFNTAKAVRLLYYPDSGRSKGVGFVEYENAEMALKAYHKSQDMVIDGRSILIDFAQERGANSGGIHRTRGMMGGYGGLAKGSGRTGDVQPYDGGGGGGRFRNMGGGGGGGVGGGGGNRRWSGGGSGGYGGGGGGYGGGGYGGGGGGYGGGGRNRNQGRFRSGGGGGRSGGGGGGYGGGRYGGGGGGGGRGGGGRGRSGGRYFQ